MTNNSVVLAIDIGTTSLKAAFVGASGEVFSFKRVEYAELSQTNVIVGRDPTILSPKDCPILRFDLGSDSTARSRGLSIKSGNDIDCKSKNGAAAWSEAVKSFLPSPLLANCAAVSVSGNGPTIVAADGTTLSWGADGAETACKPKTASGTKTACKPKTAAGLDSGLFSKFPAPDAQKKIYAPRLAAFKEIFPAAWEQSPRLYSSSAWLCDWIQKNAAALGLAAGVPVFDAGPDFVAALVGTATLFSGRLCDRAGSSEGLNLCSPKFFESPGLRTMPSPAKGFWNVSCLIPDPGSSQEEKVQNFQKAFNALKAAAAANGVPFGERVVVTGGQARDKDLLKAKEQASGATITTAQISDAELLGNAAAAFFRLGIYPSLEEAAFRIARIDAPQNGEQFPRFYSVPQDLRAIIFDIDSTLYTNAAYAFEQVDCQVRRFATLRGISNEEARKMVSDYRKKYAAENGGKKVSLSNTLRSFGISIEQSVQWRRELIEPADFLGRDERLRQTLADLARRYKLLCVTNNPILPARKTLDALGVSEFIEVLVGLDTCNLSKPAKEPFARAADEAGVPMDKIISVGDRYDLDIAPALELGMGGVLVRGVEDVYKLPGLLNS